MPFDLATAKPVEAPATGGFDLSTAKPVEQVAPKAAAPAEATLAEKISAEPIVRMFTSAAEPILGAAALIEKPFGGTGNADRLKQLKGMQERGAKARGLSEIPGVTADIAGSLLSPVGVAALKAPAAATATGRIAQGAGFGALSGVTGDADKPLTSATQGALFGGAVSGIGESIGKAVTRAMRPKLEAPVKSTSAGAEKAVNELQQQGAALEAGKVGPSPNAASAAEGALANEQGATGRFREALNATPGKFSADDALKQIDASLSGTAIHKPVRAALEEAKALIQTAQKNSGASESPVIQSGSGFRGGDMNAAQYREMLAGKKQNSGMPISYVEEIRQGINDIISKKDSSGAGLPKHTQDLLAGIRDSILKDTPPAYKQSIADMASAKQALEPFFREGTARAKILGDAADFHMWTGQDKQNRIERAFKSDTPGASLKQLVRDTEHNPQAAQGVRDSYMDWLTVPHKAEGPSQTQLMSKWDATREAVAESKLMSPEHIAAMDKIMADVADAGTRTGKLKAWASAAGFLVGQPIGHPIIAAHLARDLVAGGTKAEAVKKALDNSVMKMLSSPDGALLLSQPPVEANINAAMQRIQPMISAAIVSDAKPAPRKDKTGVAKPFSMQPSF